MAEILTTEHNEQATVIEWADMMTGSFPELRLLYAIPNGAWLAGNPRQRAMQMNKLKAEGLKKGMLDLCLPVARDGWHGLYLEMKRLDGRLSDDQKFWLDALTEQGYLAVACFSAEDAIETLSDYLTPKGLDT